MWNWQEVQDTALNTSRGLVDLSALSKVLIDAAYFDLYNMHHWQGAGESLTDEETDEIKAAIDRLILEIERTVMVGAIMPYAGLENPAGTLPCDGEEYLREDYPTLYAHLTGSPFIVDADTFTTPYFPDRAVTMASITNDQYDEYGAETHALTSDENAAHTHTEGTVGTTLSVVGEIPALVATASVGVTGSSGLGTPHNNIPPSIAMKWCIVSGYSLGE
jgi:microcystin-dependent protein